MNAKIHPQSILPIDCCRSGLTVGLSRAMKKCISHSAVCGIRNTSLECIKEDYERMYRCLVQAIDFHPLLSTFVHFCTLENPARWRSCSWAITASQQSTILQFATAIWQYKIRLNKIRATFKTRRVPGACSWAHDTDAIAPANVKRILIGRSVLMESSGRGVLPCWRNKIICHVFIALCVAAFI